MPNKTQWIKEIAQEINHSQASLKRAIKDTGRPINSKYDVLISYVEWSVPKLKDVEQQESLYQRRIESLKDLLEEALSTPEKLANSFHEKMERKNKLIDTQNEVIDRQEKTIAEQARIIAEMKKILRSLPSASGE